ncbi:MAG: hypothetical protein Q9213_005625 [Squamulea squamosa]
MRIRRATASDFPTAAAFSVAAFANDELYQYTNPYMEQYPWDLRDFFLRRLKFRNASPGCIIWVAIETDRNDPEEDTLIEAERAVDALQAGREREEKVIGYAVWYRHGDSAKAKRWQTQTWPECKDKIDSGIVQ